MIEGFQRACTFGTDRFYWHTRDLKVVFYHAPIEGQIDQLAG